MKRKLLLLFWISFMSFASKASDVKLMCWNLLDYPSQSNLSTDTATRHPYYRTVVQYENPDILVTEENNTASGPSMFLNSVMNANGSEYTMGTFINGYDTDNAIYFKTSLFSFVSNTPIHTALRDISEFKLIHIATGDTIRIYATHLKADSGDPYDSLRMAEVDSLRKVTNRLPLGSNFVVCGDFNFYGDFELGYQHLLQDNPGDDGNFVDPITMTGTWHYYPYRQYHTQSTRTTSFGGGATGGLNDRFDLILLSNAVNQGTNGIQYVQGSTTPVGNDGNHYNLDINTQPNTYGPQAVVDALHFASDHLPVYALFNFTTVSGINSPVDHSLSLSVYPNPVTDKTIIKYYLKESSNVTIKIFDALGKEIETVTNEKKSAGEQQVYFRTNDLNKGFYTVRFQSDKLFLSTSFIKY